MLYIKAKQHKETNHLAAELELCCAACRTICCGQTLSLWKDVENGCGELLLVFVFWGS